MKYDKKLMELLRTSLHLADQGCRLSGRQFEEYKKRHGYDRVSESDRSIYFNMYGEEPSRIALQKMRFWRLGQHLPQSREEALLLGRALELEGEELDLFLREHCLMRGLNPALDHVEIFTAFFTEYLCQITDERLKRLNVHPGAQQQRKCHVFYSDALDCIHMDERTRQLCYQRHMYSRGFAGEFRKYFQPESVLSRETVLRLLILMMLPDLNEEIVSDYLFRLGYSPLNPDRLQEGYVDYAVLRLLQLCEVQRTGDRRRDREMMKTLFRRYDALVQELTEDQKLLRKLRFMKFRSMGNESGHP